jgi:DNA polymerase elongation subunit (family B)
MSITNLKYDYKNFDILIKRYGSKTIDREKLSRVFFIKKGTQKTSSAFEVSSCGKQHFFTKEEVERVTITNPKYMNLFDDIILTRPDLVYLYDLSGYHAEYQYLFYKEDVQLSSEYNVAYLDIETDDSLDAESALKPILMISLKYKDRNIWKISTFDIKDFPSERHFLREFFKFINDDVFPDLVLGWNVIEYDLAYLVNRAKRIGISYDKEKFRMIEFINGMDIIIKKEGYGVMKDTGGMSLNNVSSHFLGRGKTEVNMTFGKLYRSDHKLAMEYNQNDVNLVHELDDKLQMVEFLKRIQDVSGVLMRDTFFNSAVIDTMILKRYSNYVFPSKKPEDEIVTEEYEGGYVFTPPKGVFENVISIDFSAMYPSIILTFNISPDTKTDKDPTFRIDGVGFKAEPYGIFKETIKFLYDARLKMKKDLKELKPDSIEYRNLDTLQSAYKTILNSFYGVMAYKKFRLYDVDIAKSITSMGRKLLKVLKSEIEAKKYGMVIYGDTDSCFIQTHMDAKELVDKINKEIIVTYLNIYKVKDNYLNVELKDEYDRIALFGKKKIYVAKLKGTENFFIKGFSTEKYDVPKKIRVHYKEIIKNLFGNIAVDLEYYNKELHKMSLLDLGMVKKFNKPKDSYKVVPQHLKALNFSEKYLPITEDTTRSNLVKMLFVTIKDREKYGLGKKDKLDALVIDENIKELPEGIEVDYDKYYEFFFIKKLEDLFDVFNIGKSEPVETGVPNG